MQRKVGKDPFRAIFLGDYVDRGPDSRGVIDWLISLRDATESKGQGAGKVGGQAGCCDVTFLAGNHDLAMAMFLGLCVPHLELFVTPLGTQRFRSRFGAHSCRVLKVVIRWHCEAALTEQWLAWQTSNECIAGGQDMERG